MDDWIRKKWMSVQLLKIAKTTEIRKWNVKDRKKHHIWVEVQGHEYLTLLFAICHLGGNYLFVDFPINQ